MHIVYWHTNIHSFTALASAASTATSTPHYFGFSHNIYTNIIAYNNTFGWCIDAFFIYINSATAAAKQQHHWQKSKQKWKCGGKLCVCNGIVILFDDFCSLLIAYVCILREKNVNTILIINWTTTNKHTQTNISTSPCYKIKSLFNRRLAT